MTYLNAVLGSVVVVGAGVCGLPGCAGGDKRDMEGFA